MILSPASVLSRVRRTRTSPRNPSSAPSPSLPGILNRLKKKGPRPAPTAEPASAPAPTMNVARPRLLTLAYGDIETIRMLPQSYEDLETLARDWLKPPGDAPFALRIPVDYVSPLAARYINGPFIWINNEESYQISTINVPGVRVEIVSDAPPVEEEPPPPPPPPVLEMQGTFDLELSPGQHAAIDVTISSDELDMSKLPDGTVVGGMFWGKLDIVHTGDDHHMEFTGTRLSDQDYSPEFMFDNRVMKQLKVASKPSTAKCRLSIFPAAQDYCDVVLSLAPLWHIGATYPEAEQQEGNRCKWFVRVTPGSAIEHFNTETVCSTLYYEALPDPSAVDPRSYVAPHNGYGMPTRVFIPHLMKILEIIGLNLNARTNFVQSNMQSFLVHENIAYRFMSPGRLASAVDISISHDPCLWTRIFLMWRGIDQEELTIFQTLGASDKEALLYNWKEHIGWTEAHDDKTRFRVLETSILEVT